MAQLGRERLQGGKYLAFLAAGETYAISVLKVKEIIEYQGVTHVPRMPEFLLGAINLRGAIVPVVDLACRLGTRAKVETGRRSCILIVEVGGEDGGEGMDVGLMVDAVTRVTDIEASEIEPPPSFGGALRTDFIDGLAKTEEGGFVVLLDINRILSAGELARLTEEVV
ncbi:MAG: chemotaxis protein CheW [Pseudomonadota bacterium]